MEFSPNLTRSMVSGVFLCNILSMTKIILSLQLQLKSIHVDMEGGGGVGLVVERGESPDLGISVRVYMLLMYKLTLSMGFYGTEVT